jgi:hypothetical protein
MTQASGTRRAASSRTGARVAKLSGLLSVAVLLVASACATTPAAPGSSAPKTQTAEAAGTCEDPIVIHARNEHDGIQKEHDWIAEHYGYRGGFSQGLGQCKGKMADHIDFTTKDGRKVVVYFDISEWFGKY